MALYLVLSFYEDETARMVVDKLQAYPVDTVWFDIADFPLAAELAAFPGSSTLGTLQTRNGIVDLDDVIGVLYRRPAQFQMPPGIADEHRVFARVEARQGFGGVLTGIDARWVNHPSAVAGGNFKPKQLDVAVSVGMNVPRTLVTNSPEQAQKFACDVGRTLIYKAFEPPTLPDRRSSSQAWSIQTNLTIPQSASLPTCSKSRFPRSSTPGSPSSVTPALASQSMRTRQRRG